ncbi:MAG TPA: hypothetical protein VK357_07350 [Rubrobacteraceae bacterium]|nr:hypothetical protein [Rubrobacteraceae bacterium]
MLTGKGRTLGAKGLEPTRNSASAGGALPQDEISEVALRYVLRRSAVSTVTSGVRSVRNLERDMAVAYGFLAEKGQKLKAHC